MLEAAAPYARWIDVFCERGAFDADQARTVLAAGAAVGLRGRLHANQLGPGPGVRLAAELGLAAVDHCTYLDDADVAALADSRHRRHAAAGRGVLHPPALPGRPPPARRRRDGRAGQRLQPRARASPAAWPFCIAIAVREMGLTPAEALRAATARRGRRPRPRRRGAAGRRGPRRPRAPRRPRPPAPRLPARRAAGVGGVAGRASALVTHRSEPPATPARTGW